MATPHQLELLAIFDPVVRQIASAIFRHLPRGIEREDLVAAGRRGLWDAITRGREDAGTFEGYARIRIRGAIMDELRTQDWISRRARIVANRDGSDAPIIVRTEDLGDWEPSESQDPTLALASEEQHALVALLLLRLPERERHVITAYYLEDRPMKEIGDEMGISQARASQLHARGLNRLNTLMTGKRPAHCKARKPRAKK